MSDDSSNTFGDFLKAAAVVAAAYALQAGENALLNRGQKSDIASAQYAVKQTVPPCIVHIGDYARSAPAWAFNGKKDNLLASVHLRNDGRIDSTARIYLGSDWVTIDGSGWVTGINGETRNSNMDGRYIDGHVRILFRAGAPSETAFAEVVDAFPDRWATTARGDGTATAALLLYAPQAKFQAQAFPLGRPEFTMAQRGVCYDWRDVSQARNLPETWKWSPNPVVWLVHLEWSRWGLDWTRQIQPVLSDLSAQADICDEPVTLKAGGTEKRYCLAGVFKDDEDQDSVRGRIKAVMDGYRSLDGRGRLVVKAGRFETPTVFLSDSDLIESDWQTGTPTEKRVDRLQVFFTSAAADYQKTQCDDLVIDEDGDAVQDFYPEWCPSFSQAERLAVRAASRLMPIGQGSFSTNVGGLKCWGQRYVGIRSARNPDLNDIVVEVPDGLELSGKDGFAFAGRQADASIDSWNPTTQEGADPGAKAQAPTAPLMQPVISSAATYFDIATSGGLNGVRVEIHATGPGRTDLTWFWRWRVAGSATWVTGEDSSATGGTVTLRTGFVTVVSSVEVEVAYQTGAGVLSSWSDATTIVPNATTYSLNLSTYINSGYLALLDDF